MQGTGNIRDYIRTIPDFPAPGVQFRDVTTLFNDATGFRLAVDGLANPYTEAKIEIIVAMDARGFILGGAVAYKLGLPFVPIRKSGKLPGDKISIPYTLEYGEAEMEIHSDAIRSGARVLLVDDLLATGGTAEAGVHLVRKLGGEIVSAAFVIDLPALGGRKRLEALGVDVLSLCAFDSD